MQNLPPMRMMITNPDGSRVYAQRRRQRIPEQTEFSARIRLGMQPFEDEVEEEEEGAGAGAEPQPTPDIEMTGERIMFDPSGRLETTNFRNRLIDIITTRRAITLNPAIRDQNIRQFVRQNRRFIRSYQESVNNGMAIANDERRASLAREREGRCEQCVRFRERSVPRYDLQEYFSFLFGQNDEITRARNELQGLRQDIQGMDEDLTVGQYFDNVAIMRERENDDDDNNNNDVPVVES